ncbi:hypothetical protein [Streptomyces turgidiscabies]|uniref:Uncharacterized protein n=1 Tax=Streptomyces turgidiscabies TaxID=85558 RepID=A0ABU0RT08_9ACTN|nr:hypothetical protein [Streptomyces turgidiscabies]MDQ0935105.1 hypothetical protein [Streptomyces turgidiscabies]
MQELLPSARSRRRAVPCRAGRHPKVSNSRRRAVIQEASPRGLLRTPGDLTGHSWTPPRKRSASLKTWFSPRGPIGSADLVTVLASQVATLANIIAGTGNDPETVFTALIRDQVDLARQQQNARKSFTE